MDSKWDGDYLCLIIFKYNIVDIDRYIENVILYIILLDIIISFCQFLWPISNK